MIVLALDVTARDTPPSPAIVFGGRDLATHLRDEPNHEETSLIDALGLDSVNGVPAHMFARAVMALHDLSGMAARAVKRWRLGKAALVFLLGGLIANVGILRDAWVNAQRAKIVAEERTAAGERAFEEYRRETNDRIEQLRLDVRELRQMLRKMGGADPGPVSRTSYADTDIVDR